MLHVSCIIRQTHISYSQISHRDNVDGRALNAASYTDTTDMTVDSCINFCNAGSYFYAGVEWSQVKPFVFSLCCFTKMRIFAQECCSFASHSVTFIALSHLT